MYESILQQKQAIKQEERFLEAKKQEEEAQKQQEELEAKRVILDNFDKAQNSMLGNRSNTNDKKRKLDEVEKEGKEKSLEEKEIEETTAKLRSEKEEAAKPKIGSFWVVKMNIVVNGDILQFTYFLFYVSLRSHQPLILQL